MPNSTADILLQWLLSVTVRILAAPGYRPQSFHPWGHSTERLFDLRTLKSWLEIQTASANALKAAPKMVIPDQPYRA
jgi:hypothetical protein